MKHYVTVQRTQKFTYELTAKDKSEAKEMALHLAETEAIPYDISDAEFEAIACITYDEFLEYLRKDKNN